MNKAGCSHRLNQTRAFFWFSFCYFLVATEVFLCPTASHHPNLAPIFKKLKKIEIVNLQPKQEYVGILAKSCFVEISTAGCRTTQRPQVILAQPESIDRGSTPSQAGKHEDASSNTEAHPRPEGYRCVTRLATNTTQSTAAQKQAERLPYMHSQNTYALSFSLSVCVCLCLSQTHSHFLVLCQNPCILWE